MNELMVRILEALGRKGYTPANIPDMLRMLHLPSKQQMELQSVIRAMERNQQVTRIKGNRYILNARYVARQQQSGPRVRPDQTVREAANPPEEGNTAANVLREGPRPRGPRGTDQKPQGRRDDLIAGRIRMNKAGKGFFQPDDTTLKEIAIEGSATGNALHEDRVLVRKLRGRGGRSGSSNLDSGEVVSILERRRSQVVGTLQRGQKSLYVIPDDPRLPSEITVPEPRDVGRPVRMGDKVVVELRVWDEPGTVPEGVIIEILGAPDEEGVDMLSVLRQYDLPLHFDKAVLDEANAIGSTVHPHDLDGREDCRKHRVITIDPDDAKDFDDAICLEPADDGKWRLWVHIADVSHYVRPGSPLDTEARRRGNSTYLVDRVIPMLPEALSNELCSLKPDVDRLTKCVEFMLGPDGRVLSTEFYSAVIHSQRRFSYPEVLAILQRKPDETNAIEVMLHQAHELAQRIRRYRFKMGSLDLDFPESKIRLDAEGKVIRVEKIENDVSHQLIEEYMLMANEAVASRLMHLGTPAVYRVHEEPDEFRLDEYREVVLSHNVPCGNLRHAVEVQKLLARLRTIAIGTALKIGFLKSLMRARYAVEPLGHYGLAKKKYTHFTSPIRRYADLVVHRALFGKDAGSVEGLTGTAEHISFTERNSADAERDSKDVKLFAYLTAQLKAGTPVEYPAMVTEVRNFGFFVDVPDLAMSGLVPLSLVTDDFFVFDSVRQILTGRRSRRVIKLGDNIIVQVAKVDSYKKQVDFRLSKQEGSKGAPKIGRKDKHPDGQSHQGAAAGQKSGFKPPHGKHKRKQGKRSSYSSRRGR